MNIFLKIFLQCFIAYGRDIIINGPRNVTKEFESFFSSNSFFLIIHRHRNQIHPITNIDQSGIQNNCFLGIFSYFMRKNSVLGHPLTEVFIIGCTRKDFEKKLRMIWIKVIGCIERSKKASIFFCCNFSFLIKKIIQS